MGSATQTLPAAPGPLPPSGLGTGRFLMVHNHLSEPCEGNLISALILEAIDLEARSLGGVDYKSTWVNHSVSSLHGMMSGWCSRETVRRNLKFLIRKKLVQRRRCPSLDGADSYRYRINYQLLEAPANEGGGPGIFCEDPPKMGVAQNVPGHKMRVAQNVEEAGSKCASQPYIRKREKRENISTPLISPQGGKQTPPDGGTHSLVSTYETRKRGTEEKQMSESEPLDMEDPIEVYVVNLYRRNGLPKPKFTGRNAPLRERLQEAERDYGREGFRMALVAFVQDSGNEWLAENGWPLAWFLKNISRYEVSYQGRAGQETAAEGAERPLVASERPPKGSSTPRAGKSHESATFAPDVDPEKFLAEWYETVLEDTDRWDGEVDPTDELARVLSENPVLVRNWKRLMEKVIYIRQARWTPWLTLKWLIRQKKGQWNWKRILTGEMDWMMVRDERQSPADMVALAKQMARREKAERERLREIAEREELRYEESKKRSNDLYRRMVEMAEKMDMRHQRRLKKVEEQMKELKESENQDTGNTTE